MKFIPDPEPFPTDVAWMLAIVYLILLGLIVLAIVGHIVEWIA